MNRILIIEYLLFFPILAFAVEHNFDGGSITATSGVTNQPASLAFVRRQKSFTASATTFEKFDFNIQQTASIEEERPFSMRPVSVGSAFSTTYGGWSLMIFNTPNDYRAEQSQISAGTDVQSDFALESDVVTGMFSTGWKLGDRWGLGGGLALSQLQSATRVNAFSRSATAEGFLNTEVRQELQQLQLLLGTMYVLDEFVFGLKWTSSPTKISASGKIRTRVLQTALPTGAPVYVDSKANSKPEMDNDFSVETGVRFGRNGFSYLLSHNYVSSGLQTVSFGFEYVGTWGTIATALSGADLDGNEQRTWSFGFIKDHENFQWGVGPYIREFHGSNQGDLTARAFGVLYSSEIRF